MKIFITGSESFVGKRLTAHLIKKKSYDLFSVDIRKKKTQNYKKIDICNKKIYKYISSGSTVIHLAALSTDSLCKENPAECMRVNIEGTINLYKAALRKKCKHFIFASTEWVYGEKGFPEPKNEDSVIDINSINSAYALSKLICENFLKINNNINVTILRFGIIYADRQHGGSALESIFFKTRDSNLLTIGSKKTARRFIHINDIITGIESAILYRERKKFSHKYNVFNLTGNKLISLFDIIKVTKNLFKKKITILETDKNNPNIRNPINDKAKKVLRWNPKTTLLNSINLLAKK